MTSMNYIVLLAINHLNLIKRKKIDWLFSLQIIRNFCSFLNHENSRKHKEFVQLMKAHIQQENEQLLLNNDDQMDIPNNADDDIVQLPTNNAPRLI